MKIQDAEVQLLASIASLLEQDYVRPNGDPWEGSPFQWIQSRPSRQKGAIGEALVAGWAAAKGFSVAKNIGSDADRVINGYRIEIKYSNLWTDTGGFKFQQIRDQEYDYCLCLGLSPWDAQAWLIPKAELMTDLKIGLTHQHGGSAGQDTRWLSFQADSAPLWLAQFGGRLNDVKDLLDGLGRGPHQGR